MKDFCNTLQKRQAFQSRWKSRKNNVGWNPHSAVLWEWEWLVNRDSIELLWSNKNCARAHDKFVAFCAQRCGAHSSCSSALRPAIYTTSQKSNFGARKSRVYRIALITDKNAMNQWTERQCAAFLKNNTADIVYTHAAGNSRPLFAVVDTVRLLNGIRNKWLN